MGKTVQGLLGDRGFMQVGWVPSLAWGQRVHAGGLGTISCMGIVGSDGLGSWCVGVELELRWAGNSSLIHFQSLDAISMHETGPCMVF